MSGRDHKLIKDVTKGVTKGVRNGVTNGVRNGTTNDVRINETRNSRNEAVNVVRIVEIDESSDGQRIDNFLLKNLKGVPKSKIYRCMRKGEVRVNGGRVKPSRKLKIGDKVRIPPVRQSESTTPRASRKITDILYKSSFHFSLKPG